MKRRTPVRYHGAFGPAARPGLFRVHLTLHTPDGEDYAYTDPASYEDCQLVMRIASQVPWKGHPVIRAAIKGPVSPAGEDA
ncbi:MAG: hypothetical protein FIA92_11345 [Chloroflexi bacterium]|nr:hypothetical protein [Chloroflexota bacterium]